MTAGNGEDAVGGPRSPLWRPTTEAELQAAASSGLLEETHHLDLKRELARSESGNKGLAKDLAAFAIDGGTILIGVDEDTSPPRLWPVELAGLPERIEQIASLRVDEALRISTTAIESSADTSKGYVVVRVDPSARAPHMADGRYYGRGDKTNRQLPHAEVLRLHERQLAARTDLRATARTLLTELGSFPLMVAVAEPLGGDDELLVALSAAHHWEAALLELVRAAAVREHQQFAPSLADASGFARRAGGVAITTGMRRGGRFDGSGGAAELSFEESGRLVLASERAVAPWSFQNVSPQPPDAVVVLDVLVVGHLDLLVRQAAVVAQKYGFTGSWRFAVALNGLKGAAALTLVQNSFERTGLVYTEPSYDRAVEASFLDLTHNPTAIVESLAAPLLRSLGVYRRWGDYFSS